MVVMVNPNLLSENYLPNKVFIIFVIRLTNIDYIFLHSSNVCTLSLYEAINCLEDFILSS